MSTTEPENMADEGLVAPVQLPQFEKVLRGFDPPAVNSFLRTVLTRLRDLEGQVVGLQAELEEARKGGSVRVKDSGSSADRYEVFSGHVAEVVRAFDHDVERIRSEAEAEARRIIETAKAKVESDTREADERNRESQAKVDSMLEEARAEADRIRVDAQSKAEEIKSKADKALEDARARATELISDLESRRGAVMTDIRSLRDRMLEAAAKLDGGLDDQPAVGDVTVVEDSVTVTDGPEERSRLSGRGL
jgi:cell division septum initiation protein DivIVA